MPKSPEKEIYIDFDCTIAKTEDFVKNLGFPIPESEAISRYFIDNPEAKGIAAYILKKSGEEGLKKYIKYTKDILVPGVFKELSGPKTETYILTAARMAKVQRARVKNAIPGILDNSIIIVPKQRR